MNHDPIETRLDRYRLRQPPASLRARVLASASEQDQPSEWRRFWRTLEWSAATLLVVWAAAAASEAASQAKLARLAESRTAPEVVAQEETELREGLAVALNGLHSPVYEDYFVHRAQMARLHPPQRTGTSGTTAAGYNDLLRLDDGRAN